MTRFLTAFCLLFLVLRAEASRITGYIQEITGGNRDTTITFTRLDNPLISGSSVFTRPTSRVTTSNGAFTTPNFVQGTYSVSVDGYNFNIRVPNDSLTYTLQQVISNVSVYASTNDVYGVRITSADTNSGYVSAKLVAGSNITFTTNNVGANETLTVASTASGGATNFTSEVTGTGTGSVALTIANSVVTSQKLATLTNSYTLGLGSLSGTSPSWDWSGIRSMSLTLSGVTTLTVNNVPSAGDNRYSLKVVGNGTHTLAFSGPTIYWPLGAPPSVMPNGTNYFDFQALAGTVEGFYSAYSTPITALTGDVTATGPGSATATLANAGTPGTYRSVTTDAKGRVTSGTNPTTFSGYGLSDTSANLRSALTDEVGSGAAMFTRTGVRRTVFIGAGAMIPRTTAGAAPGTTELSTTKIMLDTMDFDSTTEENVGFWIVMPTTWDAGTLTFKFHWTASAGSGSTSVKWDIAGRGFADDDGIDQALGTEQASTDTLLAVLDMHISPTTPALTLGGNPAAGRPAYFQISRDTATDTLAADAKLIGVQMEYTESATEPSAQ